MVLAGNPPQLSTTLTTVLVIDDNDEDRKYWCEALKHSAHNYRPPLQRFWSSTITTRIGSIGVKRSNIRPTTIWYWKLRTDSRASTFADLNGLIVLS
jgi:hypothetical protein